MAELTLCILKPHVVKNPIAVNYIKYLLKNEHFQIVGEKQFILTRALAEKFYEDHKNKFFYDRLISFICSGPVIVKILSGENVIKRWRDLLGPTHVYRAMHTHPDSIRGMFGLSDTRNVAHGSDSTESAMREINIIFPELNKS